MSRRQTNAEWLTSSKKTSLKNITFLILASSGVNETQELDISLFLLFNAEHRQYVLQKVLEKIIYWAQCSFETC